MRRAKQSARFIEAGFRPVQTSCWGVGKPSNGYATGRSPHPTDMCIRALILRSARRARLEDEGGHRVGAIFARRNRARGPPQDEAGRSESQTLPVTRLIARVLPALLGIVLGFATGMA